MYPAQISSNLLQNNFIVYFHNVKNIKKFKKGVRSISEVMVSKIGLI